MKLTIPHQIVVYGRIYDVKWGSDDPDWKEDKMHSLVVDGYTRRGRESNAIILNPNLKPDFRLAHESLLHEVMHLMNWNERQWRLDHPTERTDPSGKATWRPIKHSTMHLIDLPLARILFDNGALFECRCRPCRRKK